MAAASRRAAPAGRRPAGVWRCGFPYYRTSYRGGATIVRMDAQIVGRERELEAIRAFVTDLDVPARSLLLAGEAGSGKTTLWRAGIGQAESVGLAVLATRPLETEAKLAYAGVGDLLSNRHEAIGELPAPQAHALRAALMLEAPATGEVDVRGVSLGFLGVIRALARERPVLMAVDDVQWLDRESTRALSFAARRLAAERVGFMIALREEARSGLEFAPERVLPGYAEVVLGPLTLNEVHSLLQTRLGIVLPRPTLSDLHETARGNPFFALELARAINERPAEHVRGETPPMPATLRELVGARVAALPDDTRKVLLAAASLADPTLELVQAATELDAVRALGPAVTAEMVAVGAGRVRFAHPLLAAASYAAAEPAVRRDIHARLAGLVRDREEHARHLALAAEGPDWEVAAALDEAARLARARGAPSAAAEFLEEARALTPPDREADARRRAVDAAGHHFAAGEARRARDLLERAVAELAAGPERARALLVLARLRSYDDDIRAAVELFETAIAEADGDPAILGLAHEGVSANLFRLRERLAAAVDHAREAAGIARVIGDGELYSAALGSQLIAEASLGLEQARETFVEAEAVAGSGSGARVLQGSAFSVAVVRMWWEELVAAKESFEHMLELAAAMGDESSVPYIHVLLAQTECLRGVYDVAAAHADEGCVRAEQGGQETLFAYALSLRALADAYRGEETAARAAGAQALRLAGSTAGRPAEQFATAALGLLELSLERDAAAVEVLSPLVAFAREQEMREPGLTRFVPDLVEALVALGRLDEAEDHLTWFAESAERLRRLRARERRLAVAASLRLPGRSRGRSGRLRARARPPRTRARFPSTAPAPCSRSGPPAGARRSGAQRERRSRRHERSSRLWVRRCGSSAPRRSSRGSEVVLPRPESSRRSSAVLPSSSPRDAPTARSPPRSS